MFRQFRTIQAPLLVLATSVSNVSLNSYESDAKQYLYQQLTPDRVKSSSIELNPSARMRDRMVALIERVQNEICDGLSALDGSPFHEDKWEREGDSTGYGRTRVLQDSKVLEKGGVNITVVHGKMKKAAVQYMRARGKDLAHDDNLPYFVCGISIVLHPHNPMAPTMHLNYRYFEIETGRKKENGEPEVLSWFGGGADLTPCYLFDSDAQHFHAVYKTILDRYDVKLYPQMKKDCDEYFYLPHRKEHRGVGGFFFDDKEDNPEQTFRMVRDLANGMLDSYVPILKKRINMPFTPEQKRWQQVCRGRYVEYNLMYDRGTKFGLATPYARIESILMSLPLTPRYEYMNVPTPGTWEERTLNVLKSPVDWMNLPRKHIAVEEASTVDILAELAKRSEVVKAR